MEREIIHLALAGYQPNADENVLRLARKYKKRTLSPKVKRAMNVILNFPLSPAELARQVYEEELKK